MFWVFGCKACGNFAPQPGIESLPLVLEDEVVTTEPPRKSCFLLLTYGEGHVNSSPRCPFFLTLYL